MDERIQPGRIFDRPDGAWVRIDAVKDGQVYYVAARPKWEHGNAWRRPVAEFVTLMDEEMMW